MAKYTIGVDFGTLAVRALVAEIGTGRELACAAMEYPHAVMTEALPDGTPLKPDWALQHPQDYVDCLREVLSQVVAQSGVAVSDIIGMGIDFTSSTTLAVDAQGMPLCLKPEFASNPYAWVMLWKHHAAQRYANCMTEVAAARGEAFLARCGGRISSELMLPRLWQIMEEAPEVYAAADRFVEAGDWIIQQLTGTKACSANPASYKLFWNEKDGYPSREFLTAVDPKLANVTEKLGSDIRALGEKAGEISEKGAQLSGLMPGTAVSVTCVDAHAALPAAGVAQPGKLVLILGTSGAHLVLDGAEQDVPGLLNMAPNGMIPGWYAYEAGQSCCGDHFKWFVDQCMPESDRQQARNEGISAHQLLTRKAGLLKPGQSGLIALDWWNGNRSVLMDADLSGLLIGMNLQTRPEEIYRALIEATAYGTRVIIENFEAHGVAIHEVRVCGGIAKKNAMLMQIYADVLKRRLAVVRSDEAPALGSAIFGAVAAGKARGGYDDIVLASEEMGALDEKVYEPDIENSCIYDELYAQYLRLHDWFGRGGNDVMHRLREISRRQKQ